MKKMLRVTSDFFKQFNHKCLVIGTLLLLLQVQASGQTFEFPHSVFSDTLSLKTVLTTTASSCDTFDVKHDAFGAMTGPKTGPNFILKSVTSLVKLVVDVQSMQVGKYDSFTYMITYELWGQTDSNSAPVLLTPNGDDTLTVSYDGDSLQLINDNSFRIAGSYSRLEIIICDVYKITNNAGQINYNLISPGPNPNVADFVYVVGEVHVQKFTYPTSLSVGSVAMTNNIGSNGTVLLDWGAGVSGITPAAYEVEWTYVNPYGTQDYDFRNNATRIFTNNTSYRIPVAERAGTLVYRVRMVRPSLDDLLARNYGAWTVTADKGTLSSVSGSSVQIQRSHHDSLNWDLKMSFVEDGKYKQVMTYYDGLLKHRQVQTRFNSKPGQTIIAQSLYDHEGRAVINSLPIPVDSFYKFSYLSNFLHPAGYTEYSRSMYDFIPNPDTCPPKETPIPPLAPEAPGNQYFSANNPDKTGVNAFIPNAEGYPMTRKILAAENSEKVLFEGQAGAALQLGNDRHMEYVYGSPLQAELNRYFGQDIGKYNYYRKMVTTDNHGQDMFSITDDEGRIVASGLIGQPDTSTFALTVRKQVDSSYFRSNLLPVPNPRMGDYWRNNGSYFVEAERNYRFKYQVTYNPFLPCPLDTNVGLKPKVYFTYEVIDPCGDTALYKQGALGGTGVTTSTSLSYADSSDVFLFKGNHVWNKEAYIKIEDLRASVDSFMDLNLDTACFQTFDYFLKQEFIASSGEFPCPGNYDPCEALRLSMIKEMYPRAKYGHYQYTDSISKIFDSSGTNSIFSEGGTAELLYQDNCVADDTIHCEDTSYYIKFMEPQQLIEIFNDSIAAALLPLHPDYCKLLLCPILRNPYCKLLGSIERASEAAEINRFILDSIAGNDPLVDNTILTEDELIYTMVDSLHIASVAFMKTICGSESGVIESVCASVNAGKNPDDITLYPPNVQDEYYRNLIALYTANRQDRIDKYLENMGSSCGPCSTIRLTDDTGPLFSQESDTTFLVSGVDSLSDNLNLPVNGSFGRYFDLGSGVDGDSLNALKNGDNSKYCASVIEYIVQTLSGCDLSGTLLEALKDTLEDRFCINNNSITTLTYDSLAAILTEVGLSESDICNAGLVDLRKLTRMSHDYVQLGLLQYPAAYYEDLELFIQTNSILDFFTGNDDSMNVTLENCSTHPFQQRLSAQLGIDTNAGDCDHEEQVLLIRSVFDTSNNAIQLAFIENSNEAHYYLYPADRSERNGLNDTFGAPEIANIADYQVRTLFNLHGFDKVSQSFANRNTAILHFSGTQAQQSKEFTYFLSAFSLEDYNMMEADEPEYMNGVGCSELIPMAREAVTMAEALDIKYGHPYFEKFFTNVVNYRNSINFDFNNYHTALVSCGVTDSVIIPKHLAHFRIKFPSMADTGDISAYIDSLRAYDTTGIAISDMVAYHLDGYYYLYLNIHEANDRTIAEAKAVVEDKAPGGSVVEYLPYQHKDTVAQLIVYNMDVTAGIASFRNALGYAFPDATITPAFMGAPESIAYYFIPGYRNLMLEGYCITMVNSTLDSAYEYNHYLDSVYRFLAIHAPMTTVFAHAEAAVSKQYRDAQMVDWRDYIRSLSGTDHYANVKGSKADQIKAGAAAFSGSSLSYKNAKSPYFRNNLYIDDNSSNTVYSYMAALLQQLQTTNGTIFTAYGHTTPLMWSNSSGSTQTRAYVCGDTTQFWINHFDGKHKMTNIFIELPDYLPIPREQYELLGISKGMEKDSVTYINLKLGGGYNGINDTIYCIAHTNRNLGEVYMIPSAYLVSHSNMESYSGKFNNCEIERLRELYPNALIKYNQYRQELRDTLVVHFRQHVIDNLLEQFSIEGADIKHGITLYYYDVAGNRVMTVPPAGVDTMDVTHPHNDGINTARTSLYGGGGSTTTGGLVVPSHTKTTRTTYNAQNKPRTINTPDAIGPTEICYDVAGRMVMTQDAKQRAAGRCTYFIYDNLSRVVETGAVKFNGWKQEDLVNPAYNFSSQVRGLTRYEVTATMYDTSSYQVAGLFATLPAQENLKNRIACVKYYELINPNANPIADTNYVNALHYSYDVSGNVKTLIHDLRNVADKLLRFKRVDYEYDLYSGKVIMLAYNRGYADQFYQKYEYDSDNRILEAFTSNNGIFWDRDAHYDYYDHGPLARMELGQQRVQGVDYAYTINGWLKAINGIQNDTANDMGMDGKGGLVTPKDVFSQRIDYFAGDYKAIGDSTTFWQLPATPKALYNGNIAATAVALAPFDNIYKKYHYDPLQRIDHADYDGYTINNGGNPTYTQTPLLAYASDYTYDPDGNLLKMKRMGGDVLPSVTTHLMDSLIYQYTDGTNKLKNLADLASASQYQIDIPAISLDTSSRYLYDANGNLVKDMVSGLDVIDWNHAGKVKHIKKQDGSRLFFSYDPLGNRLEKEVVQYPIADSMVKLKTTYIRDAAGNILAIYEDKKEYELSKLDLDKIKTDPWLGHGGGPIDAPLGRAIADKLYTAYITDPGDNLARLSMAIPDINEYVNNGALLQSMVSTMDRSLALDFVKSIPEITVHTLMPPGETPVAHEKLSAYLQPLLLSGDLESLQSDLFVTLKTHDETLYNSTVSTVPATQQEKDDFPADPAMLQAFRGMEPGDKLSITNTLAQALTTTHITTLEPVVNLLSASVYNGSNSYSNFVTELSNGETILDGIRQDGANYIAHRYAQADLEEVPLATVQDEFRYNSVLSGVITEEANEPEPEALSVILGSHFADVVDLADNTGQGNLLVTSIRDALTINVPLTEVAHNWLRTQHILQSQRQYLAEHHIYGSSRLGIQKYLPDQAQYHFKSLGQGGTTNTLSTTRPWYTLYGNDLFKPTVYSNDLDTLNMGTQGMGINSHLLGMRQYELTNHLGNVQATVLDRATPILNNDTLVTGYKSDISLAHDYYPFGMLMPGRYVSDTGRKCVTINTSILVPVVVRVYLWQTEGVAYKNGGISTPPVHQLPVALVAADEKPYVYHYNDASTHPNGEVITGQTVEGNAEYTISLSEEPSGGVTTYFQVHADTNQTEQEIGFDLTLPVDCYVDMRVRQYYTGTGEEYYDAVTWTQVDMSGAQQVLVPIDKTSVAAGGKTILELRFNTTTAADFPGDVGGVMRNFYYKITHYEPKTHIAIVCDEKDNYRFGFWAGEKDNEIKGIGNSVDLGERMMDTRTGRLGMRVDPLASKFPWQSPYVAAGNSPIANIDKNGELKYPKGKAGDAYRAQYPMLTTYLASYIQRDVNKSSRLSTAIVNHANNPEFTKKELFQDLLAWKEDSKVTINYVDGNTINGANAQTQNKGSIYINKDYAQKVEDILSDRDKKYTADEKQQAITAFYITMMDEITLAGSKYSKDPYKGYGGSDGDVGNDLTDEIFYQKDGIDGNNRVYQADKDNISDTKEVIKTIKDEGRSDVLPTTPTQ
ncbi:RHS repeat domain-containing protein [Algoriphagus sp. Y33]|uniref:RHS repeat domain-containing protein n=1 Tax=Algoriphagus sp. Y33 TaxID=2772483 RepID=UPI001781298C|nr:hypothetical protein [Algoriphagus sp. Y33]